MAPPSVVDTLSSAFEGFVAMVLCAVTAAWTNSMLGSVFSQDAAWFPHVSGAARLATTAALFAVLYGRRFYPVLEGHVATWRVLQRLSESCIRVPRGAFVWGLVAFHCVQLGGLAALAWQSGAPAASLFTVLSACGGAAAIVWAPAWEELVFRFAVFYLVLQRSRGNIPFAAAASALGFAAVHMGNILAPGSDAAGSPAFAVLQCSVAVICGAAYALAFAATGSLGAVVAIHGLNNAVAVAWLSLGSGDGDGVPSCETHWSVGFAAALLVTLGAYTAAAVGAYLAVGRLTGSGAPSPSATTPSQPAALAFTKLHPLVFGEVASASNDFR